MGEPRVSVVVAVGRGAPEASARWRAALSGPLAAGVVELLLVRAGTAPAPAAGDGGEPGVRQLFEPEGSTIPRLRAAGLRAARAPLVALSEGFCRPAPGWVDALLAARARSGALAVGGPLTRRGGGRVPWALTFAEYGRFVRAEPEGAVADLAMTNVAYAREPLLALLGGAPEELAEPGLHALLRERGETLWRAPGAVVEDESDLPLARALLALYHHGRLFGGGRVAGAGPAARLGRALASPLVPLVQLRRVAREARAAGLARALSRALPALFCLLVAWAAGEGVGSLLGPGTSGSRWT